MSLCHYIYSLKKFLKIRIFYEELPTLSSIQCFPQAEGIIPKNSLRKVLQVVDFCICCSASNTDFLCWATACVWCDAPLLLQGFGFFQFCSILWFWQGAPINKSSYLSLNMISTANYIYGIGNTSNWEWCGRSLLLLGNHLESKAANCYSACDSSLTPELFCWWNWETRGILKKRWICFREKIQILSTCWFSNLIEKKELIRVVVTISNTQTI